MNAMFNGMDCGFGEGDDYFSYWSIVPKESLIGYVAFLKTNTAPFDFIALSTTHKNDNTTVIIYGEEPYLDVKAFRSS